MPAITQRFANAFALTDTQCSSFDSRFHRHIRDDLCRYVQSFENRYTTAHQDAERAGESRGIVAADQAANQRNAQQKPVKLFAGPRLLKQFPGANRQRNQDCQHKNAVAL